MVKKILLISGKKKSGKDTFCNILQTHNPNVHVLHLADKIKSILMDTLEISREDLELFKVHPGYFYHHGHTNPNELYHTSGLTSMRKMLQNLGETVKKEFGPTIWCDMVDKQLRDDKLNVIADCRFPLEYNYFYERYAPSVFCVKCVHLFQSGIDKHTSETSVDQVPCDVTLYNPHEGVKEWEKMIQTQEWFQSLVQGEIPSTFILEPPVKKKGCKED